MSVEFKKNYIRRVSRIKFPASVVINNIIFEVINFSMQGFACVYDDEIPDGFEGIVKFGFLKKGQDILFDVNVKLEWKSDNIASFLFIDIDDTGKNILKNYLKVNLEDDFGNIDDVITELEQEVVPVEIEKPLTPEETKFLNKKLTRMLCLYSLIFIFVILIFVIIPYFNTCFKISNKALIVGDMVTIPVSKDEIIKKINVREGEYIQKGQVLFSKYDIDLENAINELKQEISKNEAIINVLSAEAREGDASKSIYINYAKQQRNGINSQIRLLNYEIKSLKNKIDLMEKSVKLGGTSVLELKDKQNLLFEKQQKVQSLRKQSYFQDTKVKAANKGGFYSQGEVKNKWQAKLESIEVQKKQISLLQTQLQGLYLKKNMLEVKSPITGIVINIDGIDELNGVPVSDKKSSISIINYENNKIWVDSVFSASDIKSIFPDDEVEVYISDINLKLKGRVQKIYLRKLPDDIIIKDNEYAVKITLDKALQIKKMIRPDMNIVVKIKVKPFGIFRRKVGILN